MADTAAHLVDRVFPRVPVRQWVLTFPHALRYRLAYDAGLVTHILGIFTSTVFASLIRRARECGAERKAQRGALSVVQRFDSALRLNLHIHSLIIDGVYAANDEDKPQFQVLPAPDKEEIARLTELLAARIRKFLRQRGLGPDSDPEESDPLARDQPWLAGLYEASVRGSTAFGNSSGKRGICRGDQMKLAALIPVPHAHLVRYAGILAPAAKWRALIVPMAAASVESEPVTNSRETEVVGSSRGSAVVEAAGELLFAAFAEAQDAILEGVCFELFLAIYIIHFQRVDQQW